MCAFDWGAGLDACLQYANGILNILKRLNLPYNYCPVTWKLFLNYWKPIHEIKLEMMWVASPTTVEKGKPLALRVMSVRAMRAHHSIQAAFICTITSQSKATINFHISKGHADDMITDE